MNIKYIFSTDIGEMKQNPHICRWRERTKAQLFFPLTPYMYTPFQDKKKATKKITIIWGLPCWTTGSFNGSPAIRTKWLLSGS